jgi:uncharacterized protein YggE
MRFRTGPLLVAAACLAVGAPTLARTQVVGGNRGCPIENAQVSVSFSGMDTNVAAARSKMDAKIAEIKAEAQEQGFVKLVMQSHNYNISTVYSGANGGEPRFQYNGSISFSLQPADKAVDFMELLAKKGYQANVNVNSFNNGNCMQGVER